MKSQSQTRLERLSVRAHTGSVSCVRSPPPALPPAMQCWVPTPGLEGPLNGPQSLGSGLGGRSLAASADHALPRVTPCSSHGLRPYLACLLLVPSSQPTSWLQERIIPCSVFRWLTFDSVLWRQRPGRDKQLSPGGWPPPWPMLVLFTQALGGLFKAKHALPWHVY